MKTSRKIQLTALAATLNGALALTLLHPPAAYAASCPDKLMCIYGFSGCMALTPAQRAAGCANAAPGCIVASTLCIPTGCLPNPMTYGGLLCRYQQ
jgi:hypothetical protein